MNRAILFGRLTKDPNMKKTDSGKEMLNFTLAVSSYNGGKQTTDFVRCVAFGKTAQIINNYCKKGSSLAVDGKINANNYTNSNGESIFSMQVLVGAVFMANNSTEENKEISIFDKKTTEFADNMDFLEDEILVSSDDLPF